MSGEWIKIEISLPSKSEVIRLGRLLGLPPETVCGYLIRFWGWASANSVDGFVTQLALRDIDMIVTLPGFADAMVSVGWLRHEADLDRIALPNFTRHNGESSKKRALNAKRQERYRNADSNAKVTLSASPEKRREEKRFTGAPPPVPPVSDAAGAASAELFESAPPKGNGKVKPEAPTSETWTAYASAYLRRYGVEPVRNRTVNGQLAQFVSRVGAGPAPSVAAFYVESFRGLYVTAKHSINLLLRDAEGLHTEWATGQHGTETQARQADKTAATGDIFKKLIQEARAAKNGA